VDGHLWDDGVAWLDGIPQDVDWRKPSAARVYDVHLGGAYNFAVDREVAARVAAVMPELPALLRANRSFLRRAVLHLVNSGVRQFLDLGSGIPTVGNVHEVALGADQDSRIVYVDHDPVAVAHSRALLAKVPQAGAVLGDLRDPAAILADDTVRELLDFTQPIGVLLVAVLHFVPDSDDPAAVVRSYLDALVPGSYLVLSHATSGEVGHVRDAAEEYSRSVDGFYLRNRDQVTALLGDLTLVEPGLTGVADWRPDPNDEPVSLAKLPAYAAVARI
jgi:SAM-dependent methyltransferase